MCFDGLSREKIQAAKELWGEDYKNVLRELFESSLTSVLRARGFKQFPPMAWHEETKTLKP